MKVQVKSTNMIWLSARGWGGGCVECAGAKKPYSDGEEFKIIIALAVTTSLKINKSIKLSMWMTPTQRMSQIILTTKI